MSTIKRLRQFVDFKGISKYKFYQLTGIANGYLDREGNIGTDKCEQILSVFPELNLAWLVTGEGEMTIDSTKTTTIATGDIIGNGNNVVAGNNNNIGTSQPEEAQIIEEIESIPMVSEDISTKTGVDVKAYIEENGDEMERINPSQELGHADHAERILKMSMAPTFLPADIVFMRFLADKAKLVDGEMYYLNTKSRPSMIRKVRIEGDKLRLIAENPTFGDIVIDQIDVIRVAKIVGMLRLTFTDYYADIEAVRRQKDKQIETMISHQGKLIEEMGEFSRRENILMQLLANKQ